MDLAERTDLRCDQNVSDPLSVPSGGDGLGTEWVNPATFIELQSLDPYTWMMWLRLWYIFCTYLTIFLTLYKRIQDNCTTTQLSYSFCNSTRYWRIQSESCYEWADMVMSVFIWDFIYHKMKVKVLQHKVLVYMFNKNWPREKPRARQNTWNLDGVRHIN
jgi:hypothetical protein